MTDDLMERIEGCIANADYEDEWATLIDARDRIEALTAKNELWRKALEFIALGSIIELDDEDVPVQVWLDDEDMRSIARAALEKQP